MQVVDQNITYPFFEILADIMLCEASKILGVSIPFKGIAKELQKDKKTIYMVGGKEVSIDEKKEPYQAFVFSRDVKLYEPKAAKFSCITGFSAEVKLTFVFFGYMGCTENQMWKLLEVFRPNREYQYNYTDENSVQRDLPCEVISSSVENRIMKIGEKYFPKQVSKLQRNQLELVGMEIPVILRCENLCNTCFTYKRP